MSQVKAFFLLAGILLLALGAGYVHVLQKTNAKQELALQDATLRLSFKTQQLAHLKAKLTLIITFLPNGAKTVNLYQTPVRRFAVLLETLLQKVNPLKVGLTLLCLQICFLVGACATTSGPVKTITLAPPQVLLQETQNPLWEGTNTLSLLEYKDDLEEALEKCNADKRALQKWAHQ